MYQWLLGALGALVAAAAARRVAPPSAPLPPRKRLRRSLQSPLEDPEQTQAKKQKPGYITRKTKERFEEASSSGKFPAKAASNRWKALVSNAGPSTESAQETPSTAADSLSHRPEDRAQDIEMLQVDKMPCGSNAHLNKEALSCSHKTIPCLSTSRNGKHQVKAALEDTLTLRPPIREHVMLEATSSESGKMGRPFCTAEEDVQRGEKEKYKQLLKLVKEKYPRGCPTPQSTNFCNAQAYSKEPVMPASLWEERGQGEAHYPYMTLKNGVKHADARGPQWSQKNDMLRYYPPAEGSHERRRLVKQASAGRQRGSEISDEVSFRLHLAPVSSRNSSTVDVEEKKFPGSEKRTEGLSLLTEAMEREIIAAFDEGEPDEIMSSAFKLKVTREDIHTLRNLHWLNDEIINFYMNLLVERSKKEGYPALYAFSTFFYPKLISGGYKAVRRWTRGVDLFKQDLILVPIHLRVHWSLVVIDVRRKSIRYFDSVGQKGDKICGTIFQYLQEESKEKRNLELSFSEWVLHSMEPHEIPQQLNGSDCGVFMCKYADYISRDKPITFTQSNMPYFRRRMVWEILHRQLL